MYVDPADIRADLDLPFEDLPLNITYKYRNESVSDVNLTTGAVTDTFIDIALVAIKGRFSAREIAFSDGFLEFGDVYYQIRKDHLKDGVTQLEPKNTDLIIDAGETLKVFGWAEDTSEMKYKVFARKIN